MAKRGPLPFMKSIEDAVELCKRERDNFYVSAFMIEAWLGTVVLRAAAEYSEKKNAKDRAMQVGQAWSAFLEVFGSAKDDEFFHILQSLYRFAEYDDPQSEMLLQSIVPLSYEHECFSDFIGPKTCNIVQRPAEAITLIKRSIERWCEWLDSFIHFNTHAEWHLMPDKFDQDPEKRELAALGVNQRQFGDMSAFGRSWWEWHHGEAAVRFKDSSKWTTVGKVMASEKTRHWNYPDLDTAIISIWPLVKRHNWTYRDLMDFLKRVEAHAAAYPCEREQDFAAYCFNVLGLRKSGQGRTAANGRPVGHEVAMRLFNKSAGESSSS